MEEGPLPPLRGKVILLVWIGNKGVIRGHHSNIEVDEVLEEGRLVGSWITRGNCMTLAQPSPKDLIELTSIVPMALNVPVGIDIARLVLLHAGCLNLLETPLRQVDIASTEIASEILVFQSECSRERANFGVISRRRITHNFNHPVILGVADSGVTVARNFPICLRDRSGDLVRVEIAAGLGVDKPNGIAITREAKFLIWLILCLMAVRVEEPVVVGILVMVTRDLLLC